MRCESDHDQHLDRPASDSKIDNKREEPRVSGGLRRVEEISQNYPHCITAVSNTSVSFLNVAAAYTGADLS